MTVTQYINHIIKTMSEYLLFIFLTFLKCLIRFWVLVWFAINNNKFNIIMTALFSISILIDGIAGLIYAVIGYLIGHVLGLIIFSRYDK